MGRHDHSGGSVMSYGPGFCRARASRKLRQYQGAAGPAIIPSGRKNGDAKAMVGLPSAARWGATAIRAALVLVSLIASSAAFAERRVALVIGQSQYVNVPKLDNPANDAKLIASTLAKLHFEIVGGGAELDLDKAHFDDVLRQFSDKAQGADVVVVYYAGHGVQADGENFLVPIDAKPAKPADVYLQMVQATVILKQLEDAGAKLNIILLDACRNDPFGGRSIRATGGGLAQMRAPEGTLISYATQPGNVALDGEQGDSPYTLALAEAIQKPGVGLFETFNAVGLAVKRATNGAQQPWVSSSPIEGGFYFSGVAPGGVAPVVAKVETPADGSSSGRTPGPPSTPQPSPSPVDVVSACDALAGSPRDSQLPPGVRGVDFADVDPDKATAACREATVANPKSGRLMFEYGRALLKSGDYDQAEQWYRKGAAAGSFAAMDGVGQLAETGKGAKRDLAAALAWYKKAADGGNSTAMFRIGLLYYKGLGVTQDDKQAYLWFLKSAQAGDPAAMTGVGKALLEGNGVAKNAGEALLWFRKGAEAGNASSMTHLGVCYAKGEGVARNPTEAASWFRKAAEAGYAEAMLKLADAYETGDGVEKNEAQAKLWRRKAKQ